MIFNSTSEITGIINTEIAKLNNFSSNMHIIKEPSNLYEPIIYAMGQGGKRIRPTMLVLSCYINDGNVEDAINPAIGLEVFHNFTLLHDDIMDKADIRRGNPTVYHKWNTNIAILSGDAMYALAIKYLTKTNTEFVSPILDVFYKTSIEICEGQQYDADFETAQNVSVEEYTKMIRLKTAVALAAAMKVGAIIAKRDTILQEQLYQYGINVGIAFQIVDDLLDVYADTSVFGKKRGGDILCCKKTFVYLKALELADEQTKNELIRLYNSNDLDPEVKINSVIDIFNKLNVKEAVEQVVDEYHAKADEIIANVDIEPSKLKMLVEYCDKLSHRNY